MPSLLSTIGRVLCCLLLSHGCWAADDWPTEDEVKSWVSERYVKPFQAGDIDTWINAFAENAVALHNRRPPDEGPAAIRAFGEAVHRYFILARYEVRVDEVRRLGDAFVSRGSFTTRFEQRSDGASPWGEEQGKFVLLWARQSDGEWRIELDMGNSNQ